MNFSVPKETFDKSHYCYRVLKLQKLTKDLDRLDPAQVRDDALGQLEDIQAYAKELLEYIEETTKP